VRVLRYVAPPPARGVLGYGREYGLALARLVWVLRGLRSEPPFDVVIACNPPDFLIQLARPFRRRGAGVIFDYHDPSPELFTTTFGRRGPLRLALLGLERLAFEFADVVMTVNDPCAELVRSRGRVPADRVYVVRNYPDPARFFPVEPRPELRRGRKHLVLWIGRMSPKEGLQLMLEAADELVNSRGRTDVSFTIVGRGNVRDALVSEVGRRRLNGAVELPGEADDPLLRDYIATADLCLSLDECNELNDRSIMIKVLEYMAMGRPVVQFQLAEMERVCGDATVYARDGDAVDLADRIARLLDDPETRSRLGERALRRIENGLTWPHQLPTLLSAVERAVLVRRNGGR
jgi:glycosyltransferase involved in cell wall biosynthesis